MIARTQRSATSSVTLSERNRGTVQRVPRVNLGEVDALGLIEVAPYLVTIEVVPKLGIPISKFQRCLDPSR